MTQDMLVFGCTVRQLILRKFFAYDKPKFHNNNIPRLNVWRSSEGNPLVKLQNQQGHET